ncbi:polysaccharide deacetylase family protein [Bacillus badius]|nr:polysaccharide deacetylase family protein [Bacillus badius]MED4717115.1 polysaccharide deacetylase family protein [Bacillus badius]
MLITTTLILLFLLIYSAGATLFIRIFEIGICKRGNKTAEKMIALTFDDGPDPLYTPLLLDLLDQHGAKATFFLVGEKARAHPDIVRMIHKKGHTIGLHNDIHRSNWFFLPFAFKKQLIRAQTALKEITGELPLYYRPPWGHFNLFTLRDAKPLRIIMWTAIPGDWKEQVQPAVLAGKLLKERKSGAIITLHDSGTTFGADEHAPANTLKALEIFFADEGSTHYQFVTVDTLLQASRRSKQ